MSLLKHFIEFAEEALDDKVNDKDACEIWQKHWGDTRFLSGKSETLTNQFSDSILATHSIRKDENQFLNYSNTEEFIEKYHIVNIEYKLKIDCRVIQDGFRPHLLSWMFFKKIPLLSGKKLEFYIDDCNVPQPFMVKWKVRNVGEEAKKRNQIRGQILSDGGNHQRIEHSNFHGPHFVECFIIKNNICVARDRIDVPIN